MSAVHGRYFGEIALGGTCYRVEIEAEAVGAQASAAAVFGRGYFVVAK